MSVATLTRRQAERGAASATIEVHAAIAPIAEEWDALALEAGAAPFARPGWIKAWWSEFGEGELRIIALREGDRLRAVLPLRERDGLLSGTANEHTPLFEMVAADREAAVAATRAVLRMGARRLELRELEASGLTAQALLEAARAQGWRTRVRETRCAPVVEIGDGPGAYPASLSGRKRRDLARRLRKLAGRGRVTVEWQDGSERLEELLAEGIPLEGSGWKDDAGTSIAASAQAVRFYSAIAHWAAEAGLLRLGFIRLDRRPVAFQLTFWDERASWMLKGGFDPAFSEFSPGVLMLQELVARTHALGLPRAELLGDEESYKRHFARATSRIVRAQAFAPTVAGRLDRVREAYARPLAQKLTAGVRQ